MNRTPHLATTAETDWQFSLTDLIPLDRLQEIQDSFSLANQVASTITDPNGVPITRPSNHCGVCTTIRATDKGLQNCVNSGRKLGLLAKERMCSVHMQCRSIGFIDAAAPIVVNDRHIANWLIGQYCVADVDEQRVRDYALEIGADPEQMVASFVAMEKMPLAEFEKKLKFLELMANELSRMGYLHLQQTLQTEQLATIGNELELHRNRLEELVTARTSELEEANRQLQEEINQRAKVQRRQIRLITAIESAAEAILITSNKGRIIYVNPAFERLTGFTKEEVVGLKPNILKTDYHDNAFYQQLWRTIAGGDTWSGKFINQKKDGTLFEVESNISPVINDAGKVISYVGVQRDVTRERQMEERLKQAQRLETIGTLAAGVAHELNTPIQYILTNIHFLLEVFHDLDALQQKFLHLTDLAAETFPSETREIQRMSEELDLATLMDEADQALTQSLDGLDKLAQIVRNMKDFADPGGGSRELHDLGELIRVTVDVSHNIWSQVAELELSLDENIPEVPVHAGKLKQVLVDMIINAAHAISDQLNEQPTTRGKITITSRLEGEQVLILVADNGTGIPEQTIRRIFDPFFTTKEVGKGKGQSLGVAYRVIVDDHDGAITVDSQLGKGTTFTISLPLQADDSTSQP